MTIEKLSYVVRAWKAELYDLKHFWEECRCEEYN